MTGDCGVFKFLQRSVDGKHLMRFQSETFVFIFLWRCVDGALSCSRDSVPASRFTLEHKRARRRHEREIEWRSHETPSLLFAVRARDLKVILLECSVFPRRIFVDLMHGLFSNANFNGCIFSRLHNL